MRCTPWRSYPVAMIGPASLYPVQLEAGTDVLWRAGATPLGLFLLHSPGSRLLRQQLQGPGHPLARVALVLCPLRNGSWAGLPPFLVDPTHPSFCRDQVTDLVYGAYVVGVFGQPAI